MPEVPIFVRVPRALKAKFDREAKRKDRTQAQLMREILRERYAEKR